MSVSGGEASGLRIETLTGAAMVDALGEVARLRITVFRDWPYLYDGTIDYERDYLAGFARAEDAAIVAVRDGDRIVGAATAAPLDGHTAEFVPLFAKRGLEPARVFYCGESVLLASYRGLGVGHAFFDRREMHACACRGSAGPYTHMAFCAVQRDAGDPRVPAGYAPLDDFWRRRGYRPVEGLVGNYAWKEIGEEVETIKPMQFWLKTL